VNRIDFAASAGEERQLAAREDGGLKANAIGFVDGLSIGLASTAPAYSLAAVIGLVVVEVGVQAPAAFLTAFIPMFLIAAAFFYMNRADPDAGTTFSWVTRVGFLAFGCALLVLWRLAGHERFFGRKPFEMVDTDVAEGRVKVIAEEV
jgi:hypothetical protein